MKKELENLWYNHMIEEIAERTDKEKEIIKNLTESDNQLRDKLNEEQKALLQDYDDAFLQVSRISEKNAFVKGVQFATRFLIEALCQG